MHSTSNARLTLPLWYEGPFFKRIRAVLGFLQRRLLHATKQYLSITALEAQEILQRYATSASVLFEAAHTTGQMPKVLTSICRPAG